MSYTHGNITIKLIPKTEKLGKEIFTYDDMIKKIKNERSFNRPQKLFRYIIYKTIIDYKIKYLENNNNTYKCAKCEEKILFNETNSSDLTLDHYPRSFSSIYNDFKRDNINNTFTTIEDFYEKFIDYHNRLAEYRILCYSCHCKINEEELLMNNKKKIS